MQAFALSERFPPTGGVFDDPASLIHLVRTHTKKVPDRIDMANARSAWGYFRNFTDPQSGLAGSSFRSRSVDLWDLGSTLIAITAARRLRVLGNSDARDRLIVCLDTLGRLPLSSNGLPAAAYSTRTFQPCKPTGQPARHYISRLMRLVSGFIIVAHHTPSLAPEISILLNKWRFDRLVSGNGSSPLPAADRHYANRAAQLIDLPLHGAGNPASAGHPSFDLLALQAMEFGWQAEMAKQACELFIRFRQRFRATGFLTTEIGDLTGAVETGSAFSWAALFPTPFGQKLADAVGGLDTSHGWAGGVSTRTGTENRTFRLHDNAVVLEALHYKALGPLFGAG